MLTFRQCCGILQRAKRRLLRRKLIVGNVRLFLMDGGVTQTETSTEQPSDTTKETCKPNYLYVFFQQRRRAILSELKTIDEALKAMEAQSN